MTLALWKGHVAIVTGGASGLGAATASALAQAGLKVALFDLGEEKGIAHAAALGGMFCRVDVADPASVKAGMDKVVAELGAPRIMVNCAGIGLAGKTVGRGEAHSFEMFDKTIRVNLIGSFNIAKAAADVMQHNSSGEDGERGVIINTASVAAFDGQIGQAAYSASKGGVVGMTLPMARELARFGIRVMTIAPGIFWTPMVDGMPPAVQESLSASIPFPARLGKPEEFAATAAFILQNRYLNGETIRLDGSVRLAAK